MSVPNVPHISDALARSTRERFQRRYATPLSDEDGREIACNLLGMYSVFREWKAEDDAAELALSSPPSTPRKSRKRRVTSNPE